MMNTPRFCTLCALVLLQACGGGGGASTTTSSGATNSGSTTGTTTGTSTGSTTSTSTGTTTATTASTTSSTTTASTTTTTPTTAAAAATTTATTIATTTPTTTTTTTPTSTATTSTTTSTTGTSTSTTTTTASDKTLLGFITDAQGAPVAGVTVSLFHHNDNSTITTMTDANGKYSFPNPSYGQYADFALYADKSGYGFVPAITNSAAVSTKFDFNGLYRTVIRFQTLPAGHVTGANFSALRAGERLVNLPQTGQSNSYGAGDDGLAKQGVAWPPKRFTDNADGTITDQLTGLIWLKNAACFPAAVWQTALTNANQLAHGQCGLSDGSSAGQWRMPNINELESLVDVSQHSPAISPSSGIINVAFNTAYWSSTTYTAGPSNAMAIRFSDGRWINGAISGSPEFDNLKTSSNNRLIAVRSGAPGSIKLMATGVFSGPGGASFGTGDDANLQLGIHFPYPRFVDNANGTVSDTLTGLTWLKQADCINQTWNEALSSINALSNGKCGLSDGSSAGQWRMPNRAEMLSLSDRAPTFPQSSYFSGQYQANASINGPVVFNRFVISIFYWTSTTTVGDVTQAWTVYSCDFGVYNTPKTNISYALAVR